MPFQTGAPGARGVKIPGFKGPMGTTPPRWARSPAGAARFANQQTVETVEPSGRRVLGPGAPAPVYGPPAPHASRVAAAEARQARVVNTYVTKALAPQKAPAVKLGVPSLNVKSATAQLGRERAHLLYHPAVQKANAEGKVVGAKGLAKLHQQTAAITGPTGVARSKAFGLVPRSLELGTKGEKEIATRTGVAEGKVGRTEARAKEAAHEKTEPSTLEDLSIASIGIPGIGVGGDIAKLAEVGASTIPKLLAEGGAKQLAEAAGEKVAAKVAATKGVATALAHAPSEALDAAKAVPDALKGVSASGVKAAAREAPGAVGKAVGRTVAKSAERTAQSSLHSVSGIGALAGTQTAGIHTPPGEAASAFLKGTGAALVNHPGEALGTTARSLPGFVTAPASVGISGVQSAIEGSPKPFTSTLSGLVSGTGQMIGHLASGNQKEVEETVRHEVGLSPFVAVEGGLAKLHGSDLYTAPRGALRNAVESRRAASRGNRASQESGMRYASAKEPKQPVPVQFGAHHAPGEHYIFRGIGSKLEAGKARRAVALDVSRAGKFGETHAQIETNRILKAAHGKTGASKLAKTMGREYEGTLAPMAKMGIPHGTKGYPLMQELSYYYGKPEGPPVPGSLTDRMAANAAVAHPALFNDAKHAAMAKEFHAQSERLAGISTHASERARRIAQNDFTNHLLAKRGELPVLKPEERVPARVETLLGPKGDGTHWSRQEAWNHYKSLNDKAEQLRKTGKMGERKGVVAQKKELYANLKQFTKPEHSLDTSKLPGWNKQMVKDFATEQDAVAKRLGLEKPAAYVADKRPISPGDKSAVVETPFSARATHIKTGALAKSGEASARFEEVWHHSAVAPRTRMAYNEVIHNNLNEGKLAVHTEAGAKHVLTEKELQTAHNTGNFPANAVAVPLNVINPALRGEHPIDHQGVSDFVRALGKGGPDAAVKAVESLPADLKDEVASRVGDKGMKYAIQNKAKMDELVKQFQRPEHPLWRKAANVPTRVILNDPGWVFSQIFAKGIPIASALGPDALLHAPKAIKAMRDIQKMDPASQARIKSMIGSSAGVWGTPHDSFEAHDPYSNVRAIRHSVVGKKVWDLANGNTMGKWDRWNAAKMREFAAAVKADKGFRNFYGGFKGLNKDMASVGKATKGMSPAERLDFVAKHPDMARAVQTHLNQIGGNWNSFTHLERQIAPFTIFYPWIRYSLDWTFHTFPVNHPVAATALAFLAQRNSNELQRLAAENTGGVKGITAQTPLQNPLEYAYPVTGSGKSANVFPVGTRIAPTLGVLGQSLISGKPSNLLQGLNPILGTAVSSLTGTNLFTGQKQQGGLLANLADEVLGLSPAARLAEAGINFRGFSKLNQPQSAVSKAYDILEGGRIGKSIRSGIAPYMGTSAQKFGLKNALNTIEQKIERTGHEAQSLATSNLTRGSAKNKAQAEKLKAENKTAYEERGKLLKAIDPSGALYRQSEAEYAHLKASEPALFPKTSGFGSSSFGKSTFGKSTFGKSSFGGSSGAENNIYKPPAGEGVHLPNIKLPGGLGAVGGVVGSLLGNTKAEAAGLPKGVLPTANALARKGVPGGKAVAAAQTLSAPQRRLLLASTGNAPKAQRVSLSGPLTPSQKAFGVELAKQTGLSPKTIGGWMLAEENGSAAQSKEGAGDANWLNIGPGANLGHDPKVAAQKTAELINTSGNYAGIRGAVGKGVNAQVQAIQASPWDQGHYANGIPVNQVHASGNERVKTPYANPLPGWNPGRSDQGFDASPTKANQPILAVSKGKVIATGAPGWPGGGGVTYKILQGPQRGKEVYAFEDLSAVVKPGQIVKRGQEVAQGQAGGSIETGYYTGNQNVAGHPLNNTLLSNHEAYRVGGPETETQGSAEFNKQILGKAVQVPASGTRPGGFVTAPTVSAYASATGTPAASVATQLRSGKLSPTRMMTKLEKLHQVERITEPGSFGIPGFEAPASALEPTSVGSLTESLGSLRNKLAKLPG